jgi:hypothetical protein
MMTPIRCDRPPVPTRRILFLSGRVDIERRRSQSVWMLCN